MCPLGQLRAIGADTRGNGSKMGRGQHRIRQFPQRGDLDAFHHGVEIPKVGIARPHPGRRVDAHAAQDEPSDLRDSQNDPEQLETHRV